MPQGPWCWCSTAFRRWRDEILLEKSVGRSLVHACSRILCARSSISIWTSFYAAIEERDNPALKGKPVGVGGGSRRGVLTTANYEARKLGCRSAMPVFMALEKCPDPIIVPTRFDVYKRDSLKIRDIFARFTPLVEPLSLDEAFLDVSQASEPATIIASRIRQLIREETGLNAMPPPAARCTRLQRVVRKDVLLMGRRLSFMDARHQAD
jgi:hypothetical protein